VYHQHLLFLGIVSYVYSSRGSSGMQEKKNFDAQAE
jgi:hypothetical protein